MPVISLSISNFQYPKDELGVFIHILTAQLIKNAILMRKQQRLEMNVHRNRLMGVKIIVLLMYVK
jgi:hypothetical protein